MELQGIHHITAITGDAPGNLDFYTRVLGLRLLAKTVNQDDPTVYHLFYGDERARPGAELTFFEYPNAARGSAAAGMVHTIVSRVGSEAALDFWETRLADRGVAATRVAERLSFDDPEGLGHELRVWRGPDAPLVAHHPDIPGELALQGVAGVRADAGAAERTAGLMSELLGATQRENGAWELRGDTRGGWIEFEPPPGERARPGAGTVHHVAWGTNAQEQPQWLERLSAAGVPNSGLVDRHYFQSLYFREPGGVLFELATDSPGFTVDGPLEELGRRIILPPWLEQRRADVEARLTPLADPRASWSTH
ncbi:MAG: ring-cleaving dioxygenase [Solirubrobacteraceae bacterium]